MKMEEVFAMKMEPTAKAVLLFVAMQPVKVWSKTEVMNGLAMRGMDVEDAFRLLRHPTVGVADRRDQAGELYIPPEAPVRAAFGTQKPKTAKEKQ